MFQMVDWEVNKKHPHFSKKTEQIWISKFVTGFLPVGVNMERRSEWTQTQCPSYRCTVESKHHLPKCTEESSVEIFQNGIKTMLPTMQTTPELIVSIIVNITLSRDYQAPQISNASS